MQIIGCDLHAGQQSLAMLNTTTGEVVKKALKHEGNVPEFYPDLPRPVRVGIECLVGHPAEIRATEPRKQKHDRRDADFFRCWQKSAFRRSDYHTRSVGPWSHMSRE